MKNKITGNWETRHVHLDGKHLDPRPSQKVYNHSPDGFSWSFGGSGPAQLALAILLKVTGNRETALMWYQKFKWDVIAELPASDFDFELDVLKWLKDREEK